MALSRETRRSRRILGKTLAQLIDAKFGADDPNEAVASALRRRGVSVEAKTIVDYRSGKPPGKQTLRALVEIFELDEREAADLRSTWNSARQPVLTSISERPGDSHVTVNYLPDPYAPFSGAATKAEDDHPPEPPFVDHFLIRA